MCCTRYAGIPEGAGLAGQLVSFWAFFTARLPPAARGVLSVRDLLACATFVQVRSESQVWAQS